MVYLCQNWSEQSVCTALCIASLFDSITPLTDMTNLAAAVLDLLSMGGDIWDRKFLKDRTGILSYSLLMTLNNQMTALNNQMKNSSVENVKDGTHQNNNVKDYINEH